MKKILIGSLFFLTVLGTTSSTYAASSYTLSGPKIAELQMKVTAPGAKHANSFDFSVNYRIDTNFPYSQFLSKEDLPEYVKLLTDSNKNISYEINTTGNGQEEYTHSYKSLVSNLTLNIDPKDVTINPTYSDELKEYLLPSHKIQSDHPDIITKSNEIVKDEKNPYYITKMIFEFVYSYMTYDLTKGNVSALNALQTKHGVCEDYSELMVALLRAQNIPARTITGFRVRDDEKIDNDKFVPMTKDNTSLHMWVEVYLDNFGWLPSDPTRNNGIWDDRTKPLGTLDGYYYFPLTFKDNLRWTFNFSGGLTTPTVQYQLTLKDDAFQTTTLSFNTDSTKAIVDGKTADLDAKPVKTEKTILVPARSVTRALGLMSHFYKSEEKLLINTESRQGVFLAYTDVMYGTEKEFKLPVKPIVTDNNEVLIPIEAFEKLGVDVQVKGNEVQFTHRTYSKNVAIGNRTNL